MRIARTTGRGRMGWKMENDLFALTTLDGGGHLAEWVLLKGPRVNPFWNPIWKGMEPWQFSERRHARKFESRLLSSIRGHNLCLGQFGAPSDAEAGAGIGMHGEAPTARWKADRRKTNSRTASLTMACELPRTGMSFTRTLILRKGSYVVEVRETVSNRLRRDLPYTMCQHVTFSPPFLEKGVTLFDMPATKGHTFPGVFEDCPRMKPDTSFTWPKGPGLKGAPVDLRTLGRQPKSFSDYSAQLINPRRKEAWFSALHPARGLLVAYQWDRADFPWVGNWEESYGRTSSPWNGKSLTRGMEFANTPFPISLRDAVERGRFQGQPTFDWLPARGSREYRYVMTLRPVSGSAKGVKDIRRSGQELEIEYL